MVFIQAAMENHVLQVWSCFRISHSYQKTSVTAIPCIEEENQVSGLGALSFQSSFGF
jgi:hypothetical protein